MTFALIYSLRRFGWRPLVLLAILTVMVSTTACTNVKFKRSKKKKATTVTAPTSTTQPPAPQSVPQSTLPAPPISGNPPASTNAGPIHPTGGPGSGGIQPGKAGGRNGDQKPTEGDPKLTSPAVSDLDVIFVVSTSESARKARVALGSQIVQLVEQAGRDIFINFSVIPAHNYPRDFGLLFMMDTSDPSVLDTVTRDYSLPEKKRILLRNMLTKMEGLNERGRQLPHSSLHTALTNPDYFENLEKYGAIRGESALMIVMITDDQANDPISHTDLMRELRRVQGTYPLMLRYVSPSSGLYDGLLTEFGKEMGRLMRP